jgi:hypothetical protein
MPADVKINYFLWYQNSSCNSGISSPSHGPGG